MNPNTDSFCGLDFQRDYISAVQYSIEEEAVTLIAIQPFPSGKREERWKIWRRELKTGRRCLRFFTPAVACGMPAEYAIVKLVTLDADEEAPEEAIAWELQQTAVDPVEEFVFDFQEMAHEEGHGVRTCLLAACRRDLVDRTAEMVRNVKFKPFIVDFDIFALINVFAANYPEVWAAPNLIVHCEEEVTKLVLSHRGAFLGFHSFETAAGSLNAVESAARSAFEIDHFCVAHLGGARPGGIYATGSYFQQPLRRDVFFERIEGTRLLDPFRAIKCQVVIDGQQLRDYSLQLAVAVGLALRRGSKAGQ